MQRFPSGRALPCREYGETMMKAAGFLVLICGFCSRAPRAETMLFDFEEADDAGRW